jgi:Flp pilus assembly protein TadG
MRPQAGRRRTSSEAASCAVGSVGGPKRRLAQIHQDQHGAVLPLLALILVVLLGSAGFAVDLGWIYWNAIEIQHGADSAALGGVVYTSESTEKAEAEGREIAAINGYLDETMGGPDIVDMTTYEEDETAVDNDSELRATITHEVPTFFMKVFGMNSVTIQRTAVARYVLPLALGSPESYFGNDPALGHEPGLWGSIHGTYTPKKDGDRYSALCEGGGSGSACAPNEEQRPSSNWGTATADGGYLYGIEVEDSSGLTVEIFDGSYYSEGGSLVLSGDSSMSSSEDIVTWFMLYGPDPTPLDTTDGNELLCTVRYESRDNRQEDFPSWDPAWTSFSQAGQGLLETMWDDMSSSADQQYCAGNLDRGPGIYPLRVMIEHSDTQKGRNKYSLRVNTSGPKPYIYGIGDIGIYANVEVGGTTEFYLAEVEETHAGKNLIIELWDPGDITGGINSDHVTVYNGFGNVPDCSWSATNGDSGDLGPCIVTTGGKVFNGHLVTMVVAIPEDYTCSGDDCWFKIKYTVRSTTPPPGPPTSKAIRSG